MKYVRARYEIEFMYRVYVTDSLNALTGNTAGAFGGMEMAERWTDIYKPEVQRNAESIIQKLSEELQNMEDQNECV